VNDVSPIGRRDDDGMPDLVLAQFNVAVVRTGLAVERRRELARLVTEIDSLAARSDGFVVQVACEHSHDTIVNPATTIVENLSSWDSYCDLHAFVYRSAHGMLVRHGRTWFTRADGPTTVLWWHERVVPQTLEDARRRLDHLRSHGSTAVAFSLLHQFDQFARPTTPRRTTPRRPR
jgi:hypothetical protein